MKSRFLVLSALLLLLLGNYGVDLYGHVLQSRHQEQLSRSLRSLPGMMGCSKDYSQGYLVYEGEVRVLKSAWKQSPDPVLWVQDQAKFLFGLLHYDRSDMDPKLYVESDPVEVHVLSVALAPYGMALHLDALADTRAADYTRRLSKLSSISASSPAFRVKYRARAPVVACSSRSSLRDVLLTLPYDPYAAYWLVDPSARKDVSLESKRAHINPCTFPEFAEIGFPSYYWYTWMPHARGNGYDCTQLMPVGERVGVFNAHYEAKAIIRSHPKASSYWRISPVQMTLVFGRMNQNPELASQADAAFRDFLDQLEGDSANIKDALNSEPGLVGVTQFLSLLRKWSGPLKVQHKRPEDPVIIQGWLPQTKHPFRLSVYYGVTDVESMHQSSYARMVLDALRDEPIFVYIGHSGMGWNLDLKRLAHLSGRPWSEVQHSLRQQASLLYAVVGCFSQGYYGADLKQARQGLQTDLLLAANQSYLPSFPLFLLKNMDSENSEIMYPGNWDDALAFDWQRVTAGDHHL